MIAACFYIEKTLLDHACGTQRAHCVSVAVRASLRLFLHVRHTVGEIVRARFFFVRGLRMGARWGQEARAAPFGHVDAENFLLAPKIWSISPMW